MDFLNKLGAKAGETFQTIKESDATKKAMNYAEIPGLTVQIGKQESIVKKAYQEIGEAYYRDHRDSISVSEYTDQLKTIQAALQKIEDLQREIAEKKKYDPSRDRSRDVASPQETMQSEVVVPATVVVQEDEKQQTESEMEEAAAQIDS